MRRLALLLLFALAAMSSFAQTADPDPPYRVGGDVKAPVVIQRVDPVYPPEAKEKRITGVVITEVLVNRNGNVVDVRVLKPLPYGLDQAAVDAVRQWKFRPGTRNGEPVDVYFALTVNFKLDDSAESVFPMGGIVGNQPQRTPLTTVILVRHAEKGPAPPNDPLLTAEGQQRAERLARMLGNTPISAIYTTPFARTRGTAAPLAAAKSLTPVEVTVTPTYARDIVAGVHEQRGGTFVVVGHSNTTRDVLRAFGFSDAPEIPETDYDNLFILTYGPSTESRLLSLKY
jgi:2,3-bisphosphoglycerate-dependent phosphoglycerate mutase